VKKFFSSAVLTVLFLTSCLPAAQKQEQTPEAIPPTPLPNFEAGLMPEYRGIVKELKDSSLYTIEFNIADDMFQISGSEQVAYTNNEDVELNEVQLRLFPNILGGSMSVDNVNVNGSLVTPQYSLNNSLMIVPLSKALHPKEKISLSMDFNLSVAQSVSQNYGVQAYFDNVLALAHAYPMMAVYDDEGWNAEIPPQSGDMTYADMSFFIVTVNAPKDITVVTSGREISRQDTGNRQTVRVEAGPVRDFYLAASSDYSVFTSSVNGIALRFYTRSELRKGADAALAAAARAVEDYGARYAPYPYTELDFVSTPTYALGIEYPGMIAITDWIIDPENTYLEATIAHEVAHQWFYNLVGNDQLDEPWLDESLAQSATLQYFGDEHGRAGYDSYAADLNRRWALVGNQPIAIDQPVRAYSPAEYSGIIYGRGALFMEALRDGIGIDNFDRFMKNYVKDNSWGIATTEILKSEAEQQCACDLTDLFKSWIYP